VTDEHSSDPAARIGLLGRLRGRGVLRVAASYAVIAWLVLQIASVVLDPLGVPKWALTTLIIAAAAGFPIAIALAWFLEFGPRGVEVDSAATGGTSPTARGLRHYADAVVIGVLLIAVVVLAVRQSNLGKPKPPANPAIAVLPFENLSGDPRQDYFSDGLAEETLDRLGRVPGLTVIARSSSFSFKGKNVDAQTIAGKLGVTTILEGSVRRDGKRLKLSARLIDGVTGHETWSGSFDREVTDVFRVQEELARAVVDAVIPAARGEVARQAPPAQADLSAYDLYLLAKQSQWQRSPEAVQRAVSLLEKSIELDPNYAPAHAQLAIALHTLVASSTLTVDRDMNRKQRLAEAHRALALDPNLPEGYLALAMATEGQNVPYETLAAMVKQALDLNPNYARARFMYGAYSERAGRDDLSLEWMKKTLQVDPLAGPARRNLIIGLNDRGEDRKRDEELRRAWELFGTDADSLYSLGLVYLNELDDPVHAAEAARRSIALSPSSPTPDATVVLLRVLMTIGAFDEAARLLQSTDWKTRSPAVLAYEQALLAGTRPDLAGLNAAIDAVRALPPEITRTAALVFWLTAAGKYAEATALDDPALSLGAQRGNLTGLHAEQVDLAAIWSASASGTRLAEARIAISDWQRDLRDQLARYPLNVQLLMQMAALESMQGQDAAAISFLERAFNRSPTPYFFVPQVPWFARLNGKPDYDRLVAKWNTARAAARQQILMLDEPAATSAQERSAIRSVPPAKNATGAARQGENPVRALAGQAEIARIRRDFDTWDRLDSRLRETLAGDPATWRSSAFWLNVQGRYGEAPQVLEKRDNCFGTVGPAPWGPA
jgi:adenylate cyclase